MRDTLVLRGQTGNIGFVFVADTASTSGGGKTGLTNASAGLLIGVRRELAATMTAYSGGNIGTIATLGTWANPGTGKIDIKEVDATNAPGLYELHFENAVYNAADASRKIVGMLQVTGGAPTPFEVPLAAVDAQDGAGFGLTRLDANVSSRLPTSSYTTPPTAAAIATAVEQQILDDTDGRAVLAAIVAKINATDVDLAGLSTAAIAAAVWNVLTSALTTNNSIGKLLVTNVDAVLSAIKAQADKVGTNSGDSANAVTAQTSTGTLLTRLGTPAGASLSADVAAVKTDTGNLVTRITATLFSGITSLPNWLRAFGRKSTPDATALSEINSGGGTFDATEDALEAIRDRGDLAWVTGSGGTGGGSVTLTPYLVQANNPRFTTRDIAPIIAGSAPADLFIVLDGNSNPVDLTGKTLRLVAFSYNDELPDNVFDDQFTGKFKYETGSGLSIGAGTNSNQIILQHTTNHTAAVLNGKYIMWNATDHLPLFRGKLPIVPGVYDVP